MSILGVIFVLLPIAGNESEQAGPENEGCAVGALLQFVDFSICLRCFRFLVLAFFLFLLSQMSLFFCLLPFVQRCLCLLFQLSNFCSERKPSCRRFLHYSFSCRNLNFLLSSQNLETYLGATERVRDL